MCWSSFQTNGTGNFPILLGGRKSVAGSGIGGIKETQEMLDFCAENNIVSDIELIDIKDITHAYEKECLKAM